MCKNQFIIEIFIIYLQPCRWPRVEEFSNNFRNSLSSSVNQGRCNSRLFLSTPMLPCSWYLWYWDIQGSDNSKEYFISVRICGRLLWRKAEPNSWQHPITSSLSEVQGGSETKSIISWFVMHIPWIYNSNIVIISIF